MINDNEHNGSLMGTTNQLRTRKHEKWNQCLILQYKHEQRLATSRGDIHQVWKQLFHKTPAENTRLVIGTKNNDTNTHELLCTRPKSIIHQCKTSNT
jgi:hypothetical protein